DRGRAQGEPEIEDWDLRRAWRRSRQHQAVPSPRAGLRVVLAVPDSGRAAGGGAGGDRGLAEEGCFQGRVAGVTPAPSNKAARRWRARHLPMAKYCAAVATARGCGPCTQCLRFKIKMRASLCQD